MASQEPNFIDEIVQDKVPTHIESPCNTFLPWHRVKKEFIRQNQWNTLMIRMIKRYWQQQLQCEESGWTLDADDTDNKLSLPAEISLTNPLRCLVIPGDDILDIRALWRDIYKLKCYIKYLGFNGGEGSDQKGTRIHIANNAVTSLTRMAKDSCVLPDRFEAITSRDSQAFHYLKRYGPYHMVNLDLCGSMFPNTVTNHTDYYDALLQLLTYQFEHQKSEWLLFITTMVEPETVDIIGLQNLSGPTRENLKNYPKFVEQTKQFLPEKLFDDKGALNLSTMDKNQVVKFFGVALGKYLLSLCRKPLWTIAMRRSYSYIINKHKGAVMLSLAFAFKPNISPPVDETGMTKLSLPTKKYPTEDECAIKIAESVSVIRDVDDLLKSDPKMKDALQNAQADLLESAGYDRAAFMKWVNDGEK